LTFSEQCELPDEPEIVHEAFNFDARYPELSELTDIAQVAVYYSSRSRNYNGSFADDYATGFGVTVRALYRANIVSNVICKLPENADKIKVLVLTDCDCLSNEERSMIDKFQADGGTVIAMGLCGARDQTGADVEGGSYLKKFGVEPIRPQIDRTLSPEMRAEFFRYTFWMIPGSSPDRVEYNSDNALSANDCGFYKLSNNFYWSPLRPQADGQMEKLVKFAEILDCKVADLLKDISNRKPLNLNFRKRESLSGRKLELLKQIINDKVNNYLDVLELNNIPYEQIKKYKVSSLLDAEEAAYKFRKDNQINEVFPLANLCDIIENLGIFVVIVNDNKKLFKDFDGVSELVNNFPFICISSDINYY
jgi:hypothetical protein